MKEFLQANQVWARFGSLGLAAVALALAVGLAPVPNPAATPEWGMILVLAGFLLALYRPPGLPTFGLAAACLPVAYHLFGAWPAALIALAIQTLLQIALWLRPRWRRHKERRATESILWATGPIVLATLAAGAVWRWLAHSEAPSLFYPGGVAAGLVFLTTVAGLHYLVVVDHSSKTNRTSDQQPVWQGFSSLVLDAVSWSIGVALAEVVRVQGGLPGIVLVLGFGLLAVLAARSQRRAESQHEEARRMREVHLAGHRIIFRQSDLQSVARQIHAECRRAVSFSWFHFKLTGSDGAEHSWWAGPDGGVIEGNPEIPASPPTLPGVHRRVSWNRMKRELRGGDRSFGTLRLWSDPRMLVPGALEWLDALIPEMVAAIERTFLDREARLDPLTELPDRRVLESRLAQSFAASLEDGRPMAVVMCDLDHFKKINDRHGHAIGDQALTEVAGILETHRRDGDICCRYGGEEFALVLEDSDGESALAVAERIRRAVEYNIFVPNQGRPIPLRASAGVASFPELFVQNGSELLELADAALYEAKRRGRNRCLLSLGQGRLRTPNGDVIDPDEPPAKIEPPLLFA